MTKLRRLVLGAVLGANFAVPTPAMGDMQKAQCVEANVTAQANRRDGKLTAARRELRSCTDPSCPTLVRDDCSQRLDELDHAQPTIVFDVKDAGGGDVTGVAIAQDGVPLASLNGSAVPVDPGAHTFTFTAPAGRAELRLVVIEGVKQRHETVVLSTTSSTGGRSTQRVAGLVVIGVGVVGIVVGSVFGALAFSEASEQKSDCSLGSCTNYSGASSAHSSSQTDSTLSTAAFVTAGVIVAGGLALLWTAPSERPTVVAPTALPGGGGLVLRGTF